MKAKIAIICSLAILLVMSLTLLTGCGFFGISGDFGGIGGGGNNDDNTMGGGNDGDNNGLEYQLNPDGQSYTIVGVSTYIEDNLVIPSTYKGLPVSAIGEKAFKWFYPKSITIPDSIIDIGPYAFQGNYDLTTVIFGENSQLSTIGEHAFSGCDSLESITIPKSVTSIGVDAFTGFLNNFNAVNISDIDSWCAINFGNLYANPLYYAKNLYLNGELVTDIVIPDSVTSIGEYAFCGCSSLISVTSGDNCQLKSIGKYAFYFCLNLDTITIHDSVTNIGECAFFNCNSLKSIRIPNSITNIGEMAFYGCDNLNEVIFDDNSSLTSLNESVFSQCVKLESITIPDSVKSIEGTFYGCDSLTTVIFGDKSQLSSIGKSSFSLCLNLISITIPSLVTNISVSSFMQCYKLVEVINKSSLNLVAGSSDYGEVAYYAKQVITSTEQSGLIKCGDYYFYNDNNTYYLISYNGSETNLTLPSDINGNSYSINEYAFYNYEITSVSIPNGVTSIKWCAFEGCKSLTSIEISSSVESIGPSAFADCTSLTSITIPSSVKSIGTAAFRKCTSLNTVNINDIGSWCAIDFGDGSANPLCYAYNLYVNGELVTDLIIPEGVAVINTLAFYNCKSIVSITIPSSVTIIEENVLLNCSNLQTVYYAGTEQEWLDIHIFSNDSNLIDATRYYYSESKPNTSGKYWHYVDGVPTPW